MTASELPHDPGSGGAAATTLENGLTWTIGSLAQISMQVLRPLSKEVMEKDKTASGIYCLLGRQIPYCTVGSLPPHLPQGCRRNHRTGQSQTMDSITMGTNLPRDILLLNA